MNVQDHTSKEWKSLGLLLVLAGIAIAVTVSAIAGIVMAVAGVLIILQIALRLGATPKTGPGDRT